MSALRRHNVTLSGREDRPAMVFAHGFGCDQNMWRYLTPAFAPDHRIVLFDYVGYGESDVSAYDAARYGSLDGYVQDLLQILSELDLEQVIFVGHSVSSMIGVLASIREPHRFGKLVLVGPSPCYIDTEGYTGGFAREDIESLLESLDSNYLGWSSEMAPMIMGNPDRPALGEELTNSFCRTDPQIAARFARVTFLSDNRQDLSLTVTPALVLQSTEDVIAPRPVGEYVHEHLVDSELVLLEASGHCPHMSAPQETISAIRAFLR